MEYCFGDVEALEIFSVNTSGEQRGCRSYPRLHFYYYDDSLVASVGRD
jgi:hypothetical protein